MDNIDAILIMGPTCVGKSMVAKELSQESGASCYNIDDLKFFLQMIITEKINKELSYALNYYDFFGKKSTNDLFKEHIEVRKLFSYAIEAVIAHNFHTKTKLILEGSYILPYLGAKKTIMNQSIQEKNIKSVFIAEYDEEFIMQNIINRDNQRGATKGFSHKSKEEQKVLHTFIMKEKEYLLKEAKKYNSTIVKSRPFNTLTNRVKQAISFYK